MIYLIHKEQRYKTNKKGLKTMKNVKLPEGMTINHGEKKIFIIEALDKKIRTGEIDLNDLRKVMSIINRYKNYDMVVLHFRWLGSIA